jgi:hypothetical protein
MARTSRNLVYYPPYLDTNLMVLLSIQILKGRDADRVYRVQVC